MSVWEGTTGAEYSTWAHITHRNRDGLPDMVTAQASTLNIYTLEDKTSKFLWSYSFPNLAGNVCYLETLKSPQGQPDALLVGFAGNPRLAVVTVKNQAPHQLLATTLLDLGPALSEFAYGAVTPLEQDLQAELLQSGMTATLAVVLGGGVAFACVALKYEDGWKATQEEPYLLPLQTLSASFEKKTQPGSHQLFNNNNNNKNDLTQSIATGFGDILDTTFLPGYSEPTMLVLHSTPHSGLAPSGRLGRQEGGTRYALQLTAISVSVAHSRSAILWTTEVPADAQQVHACGKRGCVVVCVNSIVAISNTGQLEQCLAVNGWASTGLSSTLLDRVQTNPWPFPKLAIALDGCRLIFVNETAAFLVLRHGQVYLLQRNNTWSLLPLYSTIGALGEVNDLQYWPLGKVLPSSLDGKLLDKGKSKEDSQEMDMGLLFVGSRLGDSSLLGYALESTSVADALKEDPGLKLSIQNDTGTNGHNHNIVQDDEYDRLLQLEEEALYGPERESTGPNVVPPSDDEEAMMVSADGSSERKRARLSQLVVVRSLTVLDSLTAFGPLGPGCNGPLSQAPEHTTISDPSSTASSPLGAMGYVFPCGYGSSGGLALLTTPGRDDRNIMAEEDCVNAKAIFSLPGRGIVLMAMSNGGIRFMKLESSSISGGIETTLTEIIMDEWVTDDAYGYVTSATLLGASEWNSDVFVLLVELPGDHGKAYVLLLMDDKAEKLSVRAEIQLSVPEGDVIQTVTPFTLLSHERLSFGYTLSSGDARLALIDSSGSLDECTLAATSPMDVEDKDLSEEEQFYASGSIKALDIFEAPKAFFVPPQTGPSVTEVPAPESEVPQADYPLDDDDVELYGKSSQDATSGKQQEMKSDEQDVPADDQVFYVALCRQSGELEVYMLSDLTQDQTVAPVWSSSGCGHGAPQLLSEKQTGSAFRAPRMHKLYSREFRFFFCGPASSDWAKSPLGPRIFCLAIEGSNGDMLLYKAEINKSTKRVLSFSRVPLKYATRPSQEQSKHFAKLRRKGIIGKSETLETDGAFRQTSLFRFTNISGQDGLFAAAARPMWLVAERGRPAMLCHRSRHAAPAGSRPRPISGFCSGLIVSILV
jgi:hypothetical protein